MANKSILNHAPADAEIYRPICIFGTGRSGTTLFYRLLTSHPSLGWFSNYTNRFPRLPCLAALSRILNVPFLGPSMHPGWAITPKPSEAIALHNHLTQRVFSQPRLLSKAEATQDVIKRYRSCVKAHLFYQGKPRFVQKHTGFPRIGYLMQIFPDACFINVTRDGRAVTNSMVNVSWWDGTMRSWWWGPMDPGYEQEYMASDKEPAVLAAIVWKTLMGFTAEACKDLPRQRYLEVRYDRLVADPQGVMAEVLDFCKLRPSSVFTRRIAAVPVRNEDYKWKRDLTQRQIDMVEKCLAGHLERFGFAM